MKNKELKGLLKHLKWADKKGHVITIDNELGYDQGKSFKDLAWIADTIKSQTITITINYENTSG